MPDPTREAGDRKDLERIARDVLTGGMFHSPATVSPALVDAIIADGWRPPARTVYTATGLDALPVGAIVMDSPYPEGDVYQRTNEGLWAEPGFHGMSTTDVLCLPVTVLYAPTETARTDNA